DGIAFPVEITVGEKGSDFRAPDWAYGKKIADGGRTMLRDTHQIEAAEATCPSMMHLPKGATGECKAVADGVTIPLQVSPTNDGKHFIEPTGGLVVGKLAEAAVEAEIRRRGLEGEVTCPFSARVSKPGARFE